MSWILWVTRIFRGYLCLWACTSVYSHSYPSHPKQYKELSTFLNSLTPFNLTILLKIRDSVNVVVYMSVNVKVTQPCLTLCDSVDCSPPSSPVHGILQARIQEWVTNPFSGGSSLLRDRTQFSCTVGRFFTV